MEKRAFQQFCMYHPGTSLLLIDLIFLVLTTPLPDRFVVVEILPEDRSLRGSHGTGLKWKGRLVVI